MEKIRLARNTSIVALSGNIILTILKFALAFVTQSTALLAEAWHSFSDILSSAFVTFALMLDIRRCSQRQNLKKQKETEEKQESAKKPKAEPLNYEYIAALGIAFFLSLITIGMFYKAIYYQPIKIQYPLLGAISMVGLALGSYFVSLLELRIGSTIDSEALKADSAHARIDTLGSLLVAVCFFFHWLGLNLDRLFTAIISVGILGITVDTWASVINAYVKKNTDVLSHSFLNKWAKYLKNTGVARWIAGCFPFRHPRFSLLLLCFFISVGYLAYNSVYMVRHYQVGIIERYGKPIQQMKKPGLHFKLPFIDRLRKVNVTEIQIQHLGFVGAVQENGEIEGREIFWTNVHQAEEFIYQTGDDKLLAVYLGVNYKITDPYSYLYNAGQPEAILQALAYQRLVKIVSSCDFFRFITDHRVSYEQELARRLSADIKSMNLGLEVVFITFRDLHPPYAVAPGFEDVVSAQEEKETSIIEAQARQIWEIPIARGKYAKSTLEAEANNLEKVARARGEATRYELLYKEYLSYPEFTIFRFHLQGMLEYLKNRFKVIVEKDLPEVELRLESQSVVY